MTMMLWKRGSPLTPFQVLTDAALVVWTMDPTKVSQNASILLGGNRVLSFVADVEGMSGTLVCVQDGPGNRTLALPANSKVMNGGGGVITLSVAGASIDVLTWIRVGTLYMWDFAKNYT